MTGKVSTPRAERQCVAPVDVDPTACLVSALALRAAIGDQRLGVSLLSFGARAAVVRRVKALLEVRGVEVALHEVESGDDDALDQAVAALVRSARATDVVGRPLLDVSGASGGLALRVHRLLEAVLEGRGDVVHYDHARDRVRSIEPLAPSQEPTEWVVDVGASNQGNLSVEDLLGVHGLRADTRDPYSATLGRAVATGLLVEAGLLILRACRQQAAAVAAFRVLLQECRKVPVDAPVRVPFAQIPAGYLAALRLLEGVGLVTVRTRSGSPHSVDLGCDDQGGAFFVAGGWLEVLVAEALGRALADRAVTRNLRTTWGAGNPFRTTSCESDAAFVLENRLWVVSCKNEHDPERLREELYRLRALTAEFGEAWVRPVLLSTEALPANLIDRAGAFEITGVWGERLLEVLEADLGGERPGALLGAIRRADQGVPVPGIDAGDWRRRS